MGRQGDKALCIRARIGRQQLLKRKDGVPKLFLCGSLIQVYCIKEAQRCSITSIQELRFEGLRECLCNGDVRCDEDSFQGVRTMTMTMTDIECLRLI